MNINEWYKNIVNSGTEAPPETVWEGVQDQLDVDAVWTRLNASLSSHARKKRIAAFAVAATLFLAVSSLGLLYFLSPFGTYETNQVAQLEQVQVEVADDTLSAITQHDDIIAYGAGLLPVSSPVENELRATQDLQLAQITTQDDFQSGQFLESVQFRETAFETAVTPVEPLPVLLADAQIHKKDPFETLSFGPSSLGTGDIATYIGDAVWAENLLSSVYIGFTGQLANTWMLNDKTFTGLKSDELTFTDPSFGRNFGLQIGAGLTQRLGVRAEMMLLNRNRQTYREYINGNFVTNDIILDYYSFKLLARYNAGSYARPHYLLAGAYTGIMQQATQTINGVSHYVDNEYENLDFGVILGYEYPFPLTGHLTFTPGLFAQMGLNNVFSGSERIPDFLNRTHNASLNLSFAISYSFY